VVAEGIKEAFGDLFAINTKAHELTVEDARNKLRTLYAGKKTDGVIDRIAKTFAALCAYADFSTPFVSVAGDKEGEEDPEGEGGEGGTQVEQEDEKHDRDQEARSQPRPRP
jgi:hypothetical protein